MRSSTTAERLQEVMYERDMQPADLARLAKIDRGSISRYLSGEREPKQIAINKIAVALNVSEMWLWGYDVPKERNVRQKENDDLVRVIVRMRKDAEFKRLVLQLYALPKDKYDSIRTLVSVLKG